MGKKFDLSAALGDVSKLDTIGQEQIEYIDIDLLDEDPNNFYDLSGIEELAANIQLCGLLQPIRVRAEDDGRFRISAGHRRCAALRLLVREGHESFRAAAAIVDREDVSSALQELRLIFANSDNRKLSPANIAKQAERVELLLYQLQEEGVEFPGRMRDQVAAACNVSASKLARLKVIREGLITEYDALFVGDKLPEQTAYALARFPKEFQQRLVSAIPITPSGYYVEGLLKRYTDDGWRWEADLTCPDGKACKRRDTFLRHDADCSQHDQCGGNTCCLQCSRGTTEYYACDKACSRVKNAKKEKRDEAAVEAEKHKKKEQTKLQKDVQACACRLMVAIDAAKPDDAERFNFSRYAPAITVTTIRAFAAGEFGDRPFYSNELDPAHYDNVGAIAKKLHCSADYLLGLTDTLGVQSSEPVNISVLVPQSPAENNREEVFQPDRDQENGQSPILAGGQWNRGSELPQHSCWMVALLDMREDGGHIVKKILYCRGGNYYFSEKSLVSAPVAPVAWLELPELPEWVTTEEGCADDDA